jgi:hypothetical protein
MCARISTATACKRGSFSCNSLSLFSWPHARSTSYVSASRPVTELYSFSLRSCMVIISYYVCTIISPFTRSWSKRFDYVFTVNRSVSLLKDKSKSAQLPSSTAFEGSYTYHTRAKTASQLPLHRAWVYKSYLTDSTALSPLSSARVGGSIKLPTSYLTGRGAYISFPKLGGTQVLEEIDATGGETFLKGVRIDAKDPRLV